MGKNVPEKLLKSFVFHIPIEMICELNNYWNRLSSKLKSYNLLLKLKFINL